MTGPPWGWASASIGDLIAGDGLFVDGDWVESKDQDPDGDVRLTQLADVGEGRFRDRSNRFLTGQKAAELGCTYLEQGDVLIARMPDPLGRACIFPGDRRPCVTAVDVCVVRPGSNGADTSWLMWWLNAPQFRHEILARQAGTTRKRISRKNLASIEFPVPPLAEQRRIVAAIEEQFSRIEPAEESLRRARKRLSLLRSAALTAALDGDWPVKRLDEIAHTTSGGTPSRRRPDYFGGPIPWVKSGELRDGRVRTAEETITELGLAESSAKIFERGTLLIALYGATVGKLGILDIDAATNQAVCAIKPHDQEMVPYLWVILRQKRAELVAAGQGGAQPNISQAILRRLRIPVPPPDEQRRLVEEIERQLSITDAMSAEIERAFRRSGALRRSILKHAFTGKLVPQDASDEPASVLLERIATERAAAPKPSRRKRKIPA
jgi:type I restriction enzyme S subunit